jgi:hypothetical protein
VCVETKYNDKLNQGEISMKDADREKYKHLFVVRNQANLLRYKHVREGYTFWYNRDFYLFDPKFGKEFWDLFEFAINTTDELPYSKENPEVFDKAYDLFEFQFGRKIVNGAKKAGIPTREYHIQYENYEQIMNNPFIFEERTKTGAVSLVAPQSGREYNRIIDRYSDNFKNKDKTMHTILLGDSIFDNIHYVEDGQPDVVKQLQALIPNATLRAADGAIIELLSLQISDLPEDATHLVVSIGGNDCLQSISVFAHSAQNVGGAILELSVLVDNFKKNYDQMLRSLLKFKLPIVLCTIYEPQYPDPTQQKILLTALKLFNDLILSAAIREGIPVIDLRIVCSNAEDFANPIEPSMIGGAKIADCIARVLHQHDFSSWRCAIYS